MGSTPNQNPQVSNLTGREREKGREKQSGHQCQAALEARFSGNNNLSGSDP